MRPTALALLALALLALPLGGAQPPSFSEPYQVRAGLGDIPTTDTREADGAWHVEQRLAVQFDNASAEAQRTYRFTLPAGATLRNATCDCARSTASASGAIVTFTILPETASGTRTIRVLSSQPPGDVVGFALSPPQDVAGAVIVFVPTGMGVSSDLDLDEVGPATSGMSVIHYARFGAGAADGSWVAVHPATAAADPDAGTDRSDGAGLSAWLLPAILGVVLGMLLWSVLVSRGAVQKKSRKQVAATAAHVEAAADPPAVLEGRKRALLAALKEVELARQANEMPVEVYDAVKADLKKQAVTVMRALETRSGAPDSP